MPMEQHDDSSQVHPGVGMALTLDAKRTSRLASHEGSLSNSHPVNGVHQTATKLQYYRTKTVALRVVSMSGQLDDLFAHAQVKSIRFEYN